MRISIGISPETERRAREEPSGTHLRSVDDPIVSSVQARREEQGPPSSSSGLLAETRQSLLQFFRDSPFVGLEHALERDQGMERDIAL